MRIGERFIRSAATSLRSFLDSRKIDIINPTARESLFGRTRVKKSIASPSSCARSADEIWKARKFVPGYSPGYYAFFFEDPDGNKLEICCREQPIVAN